jgi:HK97 family phage prohead protease
MLVDTAPMDRETLSVKVSGKPTPEGVIEGYGSFFGNRDSYGDVVLPGAFEKSLSRRRPFLLWQHNMQEPIGVWEEIKEDGRGLYVRGRFTLDDDVPLAKKAFALMKSGAMDGLSIGFQTIKDSVEGGVRQLLEVDLWEVSVVTAPANDMARGRVVKGVWNPSATRQAPPQTEREFDAALEAMGFSKKAAKTINAIGFKEYRRLRDAGEEDPNSALRDAGMVKDELQRILERLGL